MSEYSNIPRNKRMKQNKAKQEIDKRKEMTNEEAENYSRLMSRFAILELLQYELRDYPELYNPIYDKIRLDGMCKMARSIPMVSENKVYELFIDLVDMNTSLDMSMLPGLTDQKGNKTIDEQIKAHFLKQVSDIMAFTFADYLLLYNTIPELKKLVDTGYFDKEVSAMDPMTRTVNKHPAFSKLFLHLEKGGGLYLFDKSEKKLEIVIRSRDYN